MGAPFINDRTHPSLSLAPPTFFHECVTWFPLNDIAINYLTEHVTTSYGERTKNCPVVCFHHSISCFFLLLWRVTSYSNVIAAFMPLISAICPVRKPCLLSQHSFKTPDKMGKKPIERIKTLRKYALSTN